MDPKTNLTNKDKLEIAIKVKERINHPDKWTQKVHARNNHGVDVPLHLTQVVCSVCFSGAILLETSLEWYDPIHLEMELEFMKEVRIAMPQARYLAEFNDAHSHSEVILSIDKTISRLQKEIEG